MGLAGGGGLSEQAVGEQRWVHQIGSVPLDEAALVEPLSAGHHGVARSGAKAGDVAVIGGARPIDLLTAAILQPIGATTIGSEVSAARKDKAGWSVVADPVLDPTTDDMVARVLQITNGIGADAAFECARIDAVLDMLLNTLRPAGVLVNVCVWGHPATIAPDDLVTQGFDTLIHHDDTAARILVHP